MLLPCGCSIVSLHMFYCPLWCVTSAMSLDMNIELCFVHCALESALWQRLSAINVELELVYLCVCVSICVRHCVVQLNLQGVTT